MAAPQQTRLVEPAEKWRRAFLDMVRDYRTFGETRYDLAYTNFTEYVSRIERGRVQKGLPPGHVAGTEYWLADEGAVVGVARIRFTLTPALEKEGGHIGYDIRPPQRRRGYGTELLRLALPIMRDEHRIQRVRITCDADNVGSRKIIERNGGVLSGEAISDYSGKMILQFWIEP